MSSFFVRIGCDDYSMALADTILLVCVRNLILYLVDILVLDLLLFCLFWGHDDNSIAPVRHDVIGLYWHSIFLQHNREHSAVTLLYCLPCYLAVYMLFVCVVRCCIVFIWALKATPRDYDLVWPYFACCLFCFVFILFPHRIMPRPSRTKKVAGSSGPLAPRA